MRSERVVLSRPFGRRPIPLLSNTPPASWHQNTSREALTVPPLPVFCRDRLRAELRALFPPSFAMFFCLFQKENGRPQAAVIHATATSFRRLQPVRLHTESRRVSGAVGYLRDLSFRRAPYLSALAAELLFSVLPQMWGFGSFQTASTRAAHFRGPGFYGGAYRARQLSAEPGNPNETRSTRNSAWVQIPAGS